MLFLHLKHVLDHGKKWKCSQSVIIQGCSLCYCSCMLNLWIPHTLQKNTEDLNTHRKILAYHSNRVSIYHHHRDIENREILQSVYLKSRYSKFTVDHARCSTFFFSLIPYLMRPVWTKSLSLRTQPYCTEIFFLSQLWRSVTSGGQKRLTSITSRFQKRLRSSRKIFSISVRF